MTTVDQVAPLDAAAAAVSVAPAVALDPTAAAPAPTGSRLIGAAAVGIALLSATATFLVLAGLTPIAPVHEVVVKLLLGNAATGLLLLAIIGREVWTVVSARRRGYAGSRLHVQIVGLFAVIAAVPTVLVAVVASTTLDRGLDRFFSTRTRAMIEQSLIVADAYVSEHAQAIRGEIMAMAFDLGRAKPMFDSDHDRFQQFFTAQATARGLSAAEMIRADGSTVTRADVKMDKAIVLP
jgi:two-component system, NtrC family, nitrogen regulation sensor histidine kinase NtrY